MTDPTTLLLAAAVGLLLVFIGVFLAVRRTQRVRQLAAIPRTCSTCKHFDLAEGQAIMKKYPIFMEASRWVPPSEMGRSVTDELERDCRECDGTGKVDPGGRPAPTVGERIVCVRCDGTGKQRDELFSPPSAPVTSSWDNYGACLRDEAVVDGADTVQLRLARRETGEGDCWERSK